MIGGLPLLDGGHVGVCSISGTAPPRPRRRRAPGLGAAAHLIGLAAIVLCCVGTIADAADQLYRARTIVTGQGEINRIVGFSACLKDVLVKVSGALTLADDPRLDQYKSHAGDYVRAFSYHDQMSGTPTRDAQGTRDRPYDPIVDFDEGRINDLLRTIGLAPWVSHRPVLAVFVEMEQGARHFVVTSDARQSDLQRDSLFAAADKWGMSIVVPATAGLDKSGITAAGLSPLLSPALAAATADQGGEVALVGHLVWIDRELGWATDWQMDWQGRTHRWQLRGITFDEAFRRGLGGAAEVMSGNAGARGR